MHKEFLIRKSTDITIARFTLQHRRYLTSDSKKHKKKKSRLFREFSIKQPFLSTKDIFCIRLQRTIDAYRRISINNLLLKINGDPYEDVELRIYPLNNLISEVRFWCQDKLIDIQKIKNSDLKIVHF